MKLKKLLCGLLAVLMLCSMLSAFAYADEEKPDAEVTDTDAAEDKKSDKDDKSDKDGAEEEGTVEGGSAVNVDEIEITEEGMTGDGTTGKIEDLLANFTFASKNADDTLNLYVNDMTGFIALHNKKTNAIWYSNPIDWEKDQIAQATNKEQLQSQLVVTYLNASYDILTIPSTEAHIVSEHKDNKQILTYVFSGATRNFSIPVCYELKDDYLDVHVIIEDIEENSDARITEITLLPFFGAGGLKDTGYALVPDGSGSLMHFNKSVKNLSQYTGYIYNRDVTSSSNNTSYVDLNETISLPVYGIEKNGAAFLAVLTEGQGTSAIKANVSRLFNSYNSISSHIIVRDTQTRKNSTGDASGKSGLYYANNTCGDLRVRFYPLGVEDSSYVGMAKKYSDYLVKEEGLNEKLDDRLTNAVNIELFCAVKAPTHFLGIPYTGVKKLTSFDDVKKVIDDLKKRGVEKSVITLSGWSAGGLESTLDTKINVESKVGNKKEIKDLVKYAEKNGVQLVFDSDVQTFYYGTSEVKKFDHTAFSLSNTPVTVFPFSKSLNRSVMSDSFYNLIHPKFMREFTNKYVDNALDAGIKNFSFKTAGTDPYAAYNKNNIVTRDKSVEYMDKLFEDVAKKAKDGIVSTEIGNSYTLGNVDNIVDSPVYSSNLILAPTSVPFYQIVLRGHVNIAAAPINLSSEISELKLKCAETGSSLFYQLMYSKSTAFENTNFSDYYACSYEDYAGDIEIMYNDLSKVYDKIGASDISDHDIYDRVRLTKFSNGANVYTNYAEDNAKLYVDASGKYIVLYIEDGVVKSLDTNYVDVKADINAGAEAGSYTMSFKKDGAEVMSVVYNGTTSECVITSAAVNATVAPAMDIPAREFVVVGGDK